MKYKNAYLCSNNENLIACQKYLIKKGYYWFSNNNEKDYFEMSDFYDVTEVVILINENEKSLGWVKYKTTNNFYENYKDVLKPFYNRKDKLKRLLTDEL